MNRRVFMRSGALALVTMGLSPRFLRRTAFAAELRAAPTKGKIFICIFQRGAADALNVLVPHGERSYYSLRPAIAVGRPSAGAGDAAIDLDGFFGLHPALAPLVPLWKRGMLAPIHAVGSPSSTRSHFDAQDYMESGTPDVKSTPDGWLNRYLATHGTCEACAAPPASHFRAVALTDRTPRILEGPAPTVAMSSVEDFTVRATGENAGRLEALYRTGDADIIHAEGSEMFDAVKLLKAADPGRYGPANGASYPPSRFGRQLMQIAQLIKAGLGVEIAFADVGGWDTHRNQGGATGQLANRLSDFASAIAALTTDLGDRMEDVVILTMSEFGRTARQNGSGGTDHGHGGAMFAIGGSIRGGMVHGTWPGLEREQLHEGRDLALTTDMRAVFAEIAGRHLGATKLDSIFPGYEGATSEWLSLLRV